MTKVITYGTYDLLHHGHIKLLERAKALGDYLIVGVTSDDYDKTRGKINNQQSLMERIEALSAIGIADEIIVEEYDGQKIDDIKKYGIDIFTLGSDWEGKFDYLREYCDVIYLPRTEGISSSEIRTRRQKIRIAAIGELGLKEKFISEAAYVNGVEIVENYEEADAVYVVSLPNKHYDDVKKALLDGKHVLCESPIALNCKECEELFALAHDKELILVDAIKTAYYTAYQRMILLAKSGKIGDIVSVDATCTSLSDDLVVGKLDGKQNSICGWGPTALLPVFQILGVEFKDFHMFSLFIDQEKKYDGFTKVDFIYENAVASIKVAKAAKSEGELIITGSKGYIIVPAPWWKTDYFELRFENQCENKRYFYQYDGDGMRYEISAFVKMINDTNITREIDPMISITISELVGK